MIFENVVFGQNFGDFYSGFCVYLCQVLEIVFWQENFDDFVFDSQFLVQLVYFGFKFGDVLIFVCYFEEVLSIGFWCSVVYGLVMLGVFGEFLFVCFGLSGRCFCVFQCLVSVLI